MKIFQRKKRRTPPAHFGEDRSQTIIGIQMASAYVGTCLMPPLFGVMAQHLSTALLPGYLILLLVVIIAMHEQLNRKTAHTSPQVSLPLSNPSRGETP